MYDKTIKLVENIVVGDLVMGVDSTPRLVLELHHGEDAMYHLHTNNGTVTVNLHHIMHIQVGRNRINIPLIEYLMWPSWKRKRARLVHYDKYNSSFTVEEAEYGTYYGFTLDGDQLYVEETLLLYTTILESPEQEFRRRDKAFAFSA